MSESQFAILVTSLATLIAQIVALVLSHIRAIRQQYQLRRVGNTANETVVKVDEVDTSIRQASDTTAQAIGRIEQRLVNLESTVAGLHGARRDNLS